MGVSIDDAGIGDNGARAIAGTHCLAAIETLDLRRNRIGAAGAIARLEAPSFHWTHIDLRDNPLGPGVLAAYSARPFTAAS